jgi:hypothetical protein
MMLGGKGEKAVVDVGATFPTSDKSTELVEQSHLRLRPAPRHVLTRHEMRRAPANPG